MRESLSLVSLLVRPQDSLKVRPFKRKTAIRWLRACARPSSLHPAAATGHPTRHLALTALALALALAQRSAATLQQIQPDDVARPSSFP